MSTHGPKNLDKLSLNESQFYITYLSGIHLKTNNKFNDFNWYCTLF